MTAFVAKKCIEFNRHFSNNIFFLLLYRRGKLFCALCLHSEDILWISGCPKVRLWALKGTKWFLGVVFLFFGAFFLTGLKNVKDYLY